jgi:DNA-binding transcriptional LysR family regulator
MFPTASLVAFAKEFRTAHPSIELLLFTEVLSAVTAHVREKQSTWGVALEDADMKDLARRTVAEVRLVPVAAPSHPLGERAARGEAIDAAPLGEAVQIVLGEHRHEADRDPGDHGVLSPHRWRVVDLATKHAFIVHGLGWGHMPEHLVREDLRAGRLVALALEAWGRASLRRSLVLVRRSDGVMGPVAKWAQGRLGELCRRTLEDDATHHSP